MENQKASIGDTLRGFSKKLDGNRSFGPKIDISQILSALPIPMQQAKRWLCHKDKKPFYVDGTPRRGDLDGIEDKARFGFLHQAALLLSNSDFSGLGFALGPDGTGSYWQGIDIDKVDENGLAAIVNSLPGYVEYSPSGLGAHAVGYGVWFPAFKCKGIEAYCEKRYFTVTGNVIRYPA
jgi:hypothetical protein